MANIFSISFLELKTQSAEAIEDTELYILQRGKTAPTSDLVMTLKQSNGKAPVMLEHSGMLSTPLLPLLPGSL